MQTGQDAYSAFDIIKSPDQTIQINKTLENLFGADGDYFVLGEALHEVKSLQKRYKVCLVEDNKEQKYQIWFAIANI